MWHDIAWSEGSTLSAEVAAIDPARDDGNRSSLERRYELRRRKARATILRSFLVKAGEIPEAVRCSAVFSACQIVLAMFFDGMIWTPADEFRFRNRMGLKKGLAQVRGMRRALTEDEQERVAGAIADQLRNGWRSGSGAAPAGPGTKAGSEARTPDASA